MKHPMLWFAAAMFVSAPIAAMHVDPGGLGQVLIFPYYTVNGGNQTLISVGNRSDAGKALKLRFLEGMNGREVAALNVYLAPHDIWTAAVFSTDDHGPAKLATLDASCTVPLIGHSTSLPQLPGGRRFLPFSNQGYAGAHDDPGPDLIERTREGYFEIIEMGEVVNASRHSLDDISDYRNTDGCARIDAAWTIGGYWTQSADTDMRPPGGGLGASMSIVDTLNGTLLTSPALAIGGFSSIVQHTAPAAATPDLSSGTGVVAGDPVRSTGFGFDTLQFTPERAIDAVTALMMVSALANDYVTGAQVGGASEWVVTMPTRKFYTDDAVAQSDRWPFSRAFSDTVARADAAQSMPPLVRFPPFPRDPGLPAPPLIQPFELPGERVFLTLWNREGGPSRTYRCAHPVYCIGDPPAELFPALAWASNVISFNQPQLSASAVLGSRLRLDIDTHALGVGDEGWAELSLPGILWADGTDGEQYELKGLPAMGFWALSVTNSAVTPGVLANYAALVPHRGTRARTILFRADAAHSEEH